MRAKNTRTGIDVRIIAVTLVFLFAVPVGGAMTWFAGHLQEVASEARGTHARALVVTR